MKVQRESVRGAGGGEAGEIKGMRGKSSLMTDVSRGFLVYFTRREVESRVGLGPINGRH